jgi:hypothetical protein
MYLFYAILPNNRHRFRLPFSVKNSRMKFLAEAILTFPPKSMRNLPFFKMGLAVSSSANLDF